MLSLTDLPLYIIYSILGTSSAAFAKASLGAARDRLWRLALLRFMAGCLALAGNFALLLYLLHRADMSVMVPLAVSCNILTAAVIASLFFRERIDGWKVVGMAMILSGALLVSL